MLDAAAGRDHPPSLSKKGGTPIVLDEIEVAYRSYDPIRRLTIAAARHPSTSSAYERASLVATIGQ